MKHGTTETAAIVCDIARAWKCSDDEAAIIARHLTVKTYCKDEIIYHEKTFPTDIFFLASGKVKIVKECNFGHTQIVRAVRKHTFLGYRAFFASEKYTTSAMAFEDSTVAILPFCIVSQIANCNPGVLAYFVAELSSILGFTDRRIVSLTQKHIRGRLADTLLSLKDSYGTESDGRTLSIAMNREDLASLSNMSTSNAIRTLSTFAHEGAISVEGKKIKILDEALLMHISNLG